MTDPGPPFRRSSPDTTSSPAPTRPTWELREPEFIGDIIDPDRRSSPWSGHRWFAYDLIHWARPRLIVELGTHYGTSFFAFVQAVAEAGLDAECHAVDTWKGDPDAGFYGEEVYEHVTSVVDRWFSGCHVTLHRCTFDDALDRFEDATIDLLHIDGYHAYEAVKHDFETWLPKVARSGIVLLHDVGRASGYGSTQYWDHEVAPRYPSFRFEHNFGLGVVLPHGIDGRGYLFSDEFSRWRRYYEHRAGNELGKLRFRDQARLIRERDDVITAQAHLIDERDQALQAQAQLIDERDQALQAQAHLIDERDQALQAQARLIDERDQALRRSERHIAELADREDRLQTRIGTVADELQALERAISGVQVAQAAPVSSEPADVDDTPTPHRRSSKQVLKEVLRTLPEGVQSPLRRARRRWWLVRDHRGRARRRRAAARTVRPYVDRDFYRRQANGVGRILPASDYVRRGALTGFDPTPGYDTSYYAQFNGVDPRHDNPFQHYLQQGVHEWRPPSRDALAAMLGRDPTARSEAPSYTMLRPARGPVVVCDVSDALDERISLVTFDLWDTLIERTRPPEAAKLDTAAFLEASEQMRALGIDRWQLYDRRIEIEARLAGERATADGTGEYGIEEVLSALVAELTGQPDPELVAQAIDYEATREGDFSGPRLGIVDWLDGVRASGRRVAIVSDFYMPARLLNDVADRAGLRLDGVPLFVSVDHAAGKAARGRLYQQVREHFGVSPHQHLHVGDNLTVDGDMQVLTGGTAVIVPPGTVHRGFPDPGRLDPVGIATTAYHLSRRHRPLGTWSGLPLPTRWEGMTAARRLAAFDAGGRFALVPTALVLAAAERARELRAERVHYLSREGLLLDRIHRAIVDCGYRLGVASTHLPVSRRSTFAASLTDVDREQLGRLWSAYRGQSVRELLESLGVPRLAYQSALGRLGIDPDLRPDQDVLADILSRSPLSQLVSTHIAAQRARATEYFDRTFGDPKVVVVADVGWRGTIQDNLARLLPQRLFHGVYLALLPYLNAPVSNSGKHCVGPNGNTGGRIDWLEHNVSIFERLLTVPVPAPAGFERDPHGEAEPRLVGTGEPAADDVLARFHDGIVAAAPTVATTVSSLGCRPNDLQDAVCTAMRDLLSDPPPIVAEIVLGMQQREDFGSLATHGRVDAGAYVRTLLDAARRGNTPPAPDGPWPDGLASHPAVVSVRHAFWPDDA